MLREEASEAPTITANPIITQFNGLIIRRNPISFFTFFILRIVINGTVQCCCLFFNFASSGYKLDLALEQLIKRGSKWFTQSQA
jgi:hypothetical protein